MDAETQWEQRKEWEHERGGIEINLHEKGIWDDVCHVRTCLRLPRNLYEIKGIKILLCNVHGTDDRAIEEYERIME